MISANLVFGDRIIERAVIEERSRRAASAFKALGVEPGDRIALLLRNDIPFLEASLAAQLLGAYPVPINWHFRAGEIMHVIDDSDPSVLIVHSDLLPQLSGHLDPALPVVIVPAPPNMDSAHDIPAAQGEHAHPRAIWSSWLDDHAPWEGSSPAATESLIYTSGTSGKPKGVKRLPLSTELAVASDRMRAQVFGIGPGDRVMVPSPIYHTAPNFFALRALRLAELLFLSPKFDPQTMLRDIAEYRISHLYAVPTIFVRLLELPAAIRAAYDLSSLRFVLHAGGPCAPDVKARMIEWLGPVIYEYYGSTEHGPLTFCTSEEWLARPGTVGRAARGVTLRIEDEQGRPVGPGAVGEVSGRNSAHPDFTYHNLPDEREALQTGALIRTGDLGYLDRDGYLFLCDRKRDVIISGGVNIYPAEIEATLAACPGVRDAAVFGVPDPLFGESIVAIVQPTTPAALDAESVKAFLEQRLARFKIPQVIEFEAALPREDSGKIRKRLVRDAWLTASQDRSGAPSD